MTKLIKTHRWLTHEVNSITSAGHIVLPRKTRVHLIRRTAGKVWEVEIDDVSHRLHGATATVNEDWLSEEPITDHGETNQTKD